MKLILKRIAKRKNYTIGKLYLSPLGESERGYLCDTLEPPCMEMKVDRTVEEVLANRDLLKAIKPCAIPEGEYLVQMTYSPKYRRQLPLITGDRRFNSLWQGIRIHSGNTAQDTQGCILVGENKIVGMVINSRLMLQKVVKLFEGNKAKVKGLRLRIC